MEERGAAQGALQDVQQGRLPQEGSRARRMRRAPEEEDGGSRGASRSGSARAAGGLSTRIKTSAPVAPSPRAEAPPPGVTDGRVAAATPAPPAPGLAAADSRSRRRAAPRALGRATAKGAAHPPAAPRGP